MPQMDNLKPIPKRGHKLPIMQWLADAASFDLLSLFDPKRPKPRPRSVLVNVDLPEHAHTTAPKVPIPGWSEKREVIQPDGAVLETKVPRGWGTKVVPSKGWFFESNQVLTSKYNIFTFIPRNLIEQFRRVANIFFLVLVILQFFPKFTTVSPGLSALPLIVVLLITAIKDGYEDLKRHQSDRAINGIKVLALRGKFHNPNQTRKKSRSFGLPPFLTSIFIKKRLDEEAEEAEEDRSAERKKGFWGKKKVRRPTIQKKKSDSDAVTGTPTLKVTKDDGGATTPTKDKSAPGTPGAPKVEAAIPRPQDREEGDFYEDEVDALPHDAPGREKEKGSLHVPHIHLPDALMHHQEKENAIWVKECWEDLKVGDFVRLRGDESVPADMIVCATSEEENVCYVETKNLDGETNLKSRTAIPELTALRTSTAIAEKAKFTIESEAPDVNMFTYNAAVVLHDGQLDKAGRPLKCPVTLNTMLLRGTVVRNTDWVIGCVVMTGRDTKIVLNSGGTPSKRSKVERQMNPMVFLNLFILALMCIMCAVVDSVLESRDVGRGAYWLFRDDRPGDNPNINGLITFANAMITFQNIVPISLYISIEFVRLLQAYFIWADNDIALRSGGTKRRTIARSWNLSDDLGQIEYIFSDKTGTLTQNAMLFRQCSIAGKTYIGDEVQPDNTEPAQSATSSDDAATRVPSGQNDSQEDVDKEDGDKKKVKLADQVLAAFHDSQIDADLADKGSKQSDAIYAFFSNLALCHTVLAAEEDGLISYKAQSPDEAALVQAAADVGFVFLGRDKNILRIQTPTDPDVVEYELLNVIEFSSARKRMSVVLRRLNSGGDGESLVLLTKGADNIIFERLGPGNEEMKKKTDNALEAFANEGLRTLCLAYKPLDEDEYDQWEREYHEASTVIDGREAAMEAVAERLEQNLRLLGATAIEDRLQDGVPEAIADLKRAGLKIWVATGDKLETAIAIGKTCNLLSRDMNLIIIKGGEYGQPNSAYAQLKSAMERFFNAGSLIAQMENQPPDEVAVNRPPLNRATTGVSGITDIVGADNGQRPGGYGLVIDGSSLRHALSEPFTKDLLLELGTRCRAVICCRVSPLQKALIVRLVKDGLGVMCLAIGDGANDVSMIQAADIGVGVAGEEGLQAVNSSDYAIGQFRFLQRLLLVHGHFSYMRNSNMIVNFFYKEIIGIGILFWFQFYCAYSATTVYEYTYLLFWNVIWTLLPVIAIGVFDRTISDRVLMQVPELYERGRRGLLFGLKRFCVYMLDGIYQSAMIYFFLVYTYNTTTSGSDGWDVTMFEFSTVMAIAAVLACNMYNGLNTRSWTWWVLGSVLAGPVLILCYTAVYAAFPPSLIWTTVYGYNHFLWPSAYFWFGAILTIVLSLIPRYLYRFLSENYFPNDIDVLGWVDKMNPKHDWINDPAMPKAPGKFEKELGDELTPMFSIASARTSMGQRPERFQLGGRTGTQASMTHDMSTGANTDGHGRGFGFDQADNMLPAPIARYTSRTSEHSSLRANRPRKGSIKVGNVELNPFLRTPGSNRARSGSLRLNLFGHHRKSTIPESPAGSPDPGSRSSPNPGATPQSATPNAPTPSGRSRRNSEVGDDEPMLGEEH
ncbi:phospholipid-translocating P-type ATPase [Meredithblackwellia eburnea MCA 4105]